MAGQSTGAFERPVSREAVRAILIDDRDRTLLFKAFSSQERTGHFWITPGGGVSPGESDVNALRRELAEECGLREFEVGPLVWVRDVVFPLPTTGELIHQLERFYLVRVDSHEVDITGWDAFEREFMTDPRWWTLEEIAASADDFAPAALATHLADLGHGRIPSRPFDAGV